MRGSGEEDREPDDKAQREGIISRDAVKESYAKNLLEACERGVSQTITISVDGQVKGMVRVVRCDVLEALQRNQLPQIAPLTDFQKKFVRDLVHATLRTANRNAEVCFRCNPWEWKLYKDWLNGEEWFLSYELKPDPSVPIGKFEVGDWL